MINTLLVPAAVCVSSTTTASPLGSTESKGVQCAFGSAPVPAPLRETCFAERQLTAPTAPPPALCGDFERSARSPVAFGLIGALITRGHERKKKRDRYAADDVTAPKLPDSPPSSYSVRSCAVCARTGDSDRTAANG